MAGSSSKRARKNSPSPCDLCFSDDAVRVALEEQIQTLENSLRDRERSIAESQEPPALVTLLIVNCPMIMFLMLLGIWRRRRHRDPLQSVMNQYQKRDDE